MPFTHAGPDPDVDATRVAALPRAADPASAIHAHALPGALADPRRLGTGSGMQRHLASLQRTAGNRAVTSLLSLQRAPVQIEEMSVRTSVGEAAGATASSAGATAGSSGPVTSDGATTTVSGSTINLAAPMVSADGVLRASTIIADSVVASSYTPGAGNLW